MSEPKRAAIYARSATFPDHGAAHPIDEQIRLCKEYAAREGYEVVEELQEVGPGTLIGSKLQSVLESAEELRFDALLICTLDRLTRNQVQTVDILEKLKECYVKVIVVTDPQLLDVDNQCMALFLLGDVAKIERERIAARSKTGRKAKNDY